MGSGGAPRCGQNGQDRSDASTSAGDSGLRTLALEPGALTLDVGALGAETLRRVEGMLCLGPATKPHKSPRAPEFGIRKLWI